MSGTKHTPGPWYVDPDNPTMILDAPLATAKEIVAQCGVSAKLGIARHISIASSQANARLIATAPELLEALKEARRWMSGIPAENGATCETKAQMSDMVDAAIAKAEGGAL